MTTLERYIITALLSDMTNTAYPAEYLAIRAAVYQRMRDRNDALSSRVPVTRELEAAPPTQPMAQAILDTGAL